MRRPLIATLLLGMILTTASAANAQVWPPSTLPHPPHTHHDEGFGVGDALVVGVGAVAGVAVLTVATQGAFLAPLVALVQGGGTAAATTASAGSAAAGAAAVSTPAAAVVAASQSAFTVATSALANVAAAIAGGLLADSIL